MTKAVYTPDSRPPLSRVLSPVWIWRDLSKHFELIRTFAARDYQAQHRNTFLGVAWTMLSPLIMLALFTFVFGYIFKGRFSTSLDESPADFALALFVGLSLYQCIAAALVQSPGLLFANTVYVKTLSFPIEVLPVAQLLNILTGLFISFGLCLAAFLIVHGFLHWTAIFVLLHIVCIALMVLGISWFLSALSVFVPDVPGITSPLSMVLMFLSGVFFSIDNLSPTMQLVFRANPVASLIHDARGAMLYGQVPDFITIAWVFVLSAAMAILGYAFFARSKSAFSDLL
jgi:lipopolysaccharide transport system permease protein